LRVGWRIPVRESTTITEQVSDAPAHASLPRIGHSIGPVQS
jgi:hypothetical protein